MTPSLYTYRCTVARVVDGDTIDLNIDLGFNVWIKERVRLYGIDTPETRTRDLIEKAAGFKAKQYVEDWVKDPAGLAVRTHKDKRGKYGRTLGEIHRIGWVKTLNQELVDLGLAKVYFGGKR